MTLRRPVMKTSLRKWKGNLMDRQPAKKRTYLDRAPSAYVRDIPETQGLLTEGKKYFLCKPFVSRKLIKRV